MEYYYKTFLLNADFLFEELLVFAVMFALLLVALLLSFKYETALRVRRTIAGIIFWNMMLRLLLELVIEFGIMAFLDLKIVSTFDKSLTSNVSNYLVSFSQHNFDTWGNKFSFALSLIILGLYTALLHFCLTCLARTTISSRIPK